MSWKSRLLAPIAGTFFGALAALGVWFAFFEYDPSLTAQGFFPKIWQELVARVSPGRRGAGRNRSAQRRPCGHCSLRPLCEPCARTVRARHVLHSLERDL